MHGHTIACEGYKQPMVRTGYEQVVAHRTTDMFAYSAKDDGVVIAKSAKGITIKYQDGSIKAVELGRRYGSASGLTFPQDVITPMELNQKFKKGDIVCYNTGFFEPDFYNPKNVVWKQGLVAKTVLWESNQTLEDASSVSTRLAGKLTTKTTKIKTIVVNFDQQILNLVKVGQRVEPEDFLCFIEDALTSNSNLFDEDSMNTLKMLTRQSPTAKVKGIIDKIEIFYNGDKEDMSTSLLGHVEKSDKEIMFACKARGDSPFTGAVTDDYRVEGNPLLMDTAAINIYITTDVPSLLGDYLLVLSFSNE